MQCDTFTGLRDLTKAIFEMQLSSLPNAPLQIPLVASFFLSLSVSFLFRLPFLVRTKVKHHHTAIDVRLPVWLLRAHMMQFEMWGSVVLIGNIFLGKYMLIYLLSDSLSFYRPLGKWQQNGKRPSHIASCLYLLHILFNYILATLDFYLPNKLLALLSLPKALLPRGHWWDFFKKHVSCREVNSSQATFDQLTKIDWRDLDRIPCSQKYIIELVTTNLSLCLQTKLRCCRSSYVL